MKVNPTSFKNSSLQFDRFFPQLRDHDIFFLFDLNDHDPVISIMKMSRSRSKIVLNFLIWIMKKASSRSNMAAKIFDPDQNNSIFSIVLLH